MKTNHAIWIVGILAVFVVNECHANLNGSDDFNDNSKDPTRWGADFTKEVGVLTETNGRLEFTTTGAPTAVDFALRPWILNYGSYTQDWEFQVDVNLPQLTLINTQYVGFALSVSPGADPNMVLTNAFTIFMDQNSDEHRFKFQITVDASRTSLQKTLTASTSAAMRIAFDANTKVLSAFYDENGPTCGYAWTLLVSTNVPAGWNMTSTSVFGVHVLGIANFISVAPTVNVFGDNFCASSGITPRLGIGLAAGNVMLSWPTNAPVCHLESASTLTPPVCWQVATNTTAIVSTNFTITNVISGANKFYRLSR
jgi:hypothetical protein